MAQELELLRRIRQLEDQVEALRSDTREVAFQQIQSSTVPEDDEVCVLSGHTLVSYAEYCVYGELYLYGELRIIV